MKKVFLTLFMVSLAVCTQAQFLIGPQAGINFANLTGTSFNVSSKPGWHVGGFISIPFSEHLSLMPAVLYQLNQYEYTYTLSTKVVSDSVFQEVTDINAKLGYLDIPVVLNYFTGETKGLMVQAGMQLSLLINDNSTVTTDATVIVGGTVQHSEPRTANKVTFSKSDLSFVAGLGYKFSKLLIIYTRVTTGFAKAQDGSFIADADRGHNFTFEGGVALSFGAK